ncbi:MAG: DEAD/DEAH box helicase, partial [Promethearchaeota archaeon]
ILKTKPSNYPKIVINIENGSSIPIFDENQVVLVSTIQMIEYVNRKKKSRLKKLIDNISLLILDEGHYEPALSWSQAIRKFNCPKVLFSATPFRNDLKLFDIDINFTYSFTFEDAVDKNFLRSVEFDHAPKFNSPSDFINQILDFYDGKLKIQGSINKIPKMIIKCDNFDSIRQLSKILKVKGRSYIAIHENFKDNVKNKWERKTVPESPKLEEAIFWIHQYKLLEGIDDSSFQFLAFFDPINDARSLVQQIGRIIRNPDRSSEIKSYVVDHHNGHHKALWDGFLEYDTRIKKEGISALNLSISDGFFPKFLKDQPIAYIDRKFRYNLNLESLKPKNDIQLPLQINFLSKNQKFNYEKFIENTKKNLETEDKRFKSFSINQNCSVIVYLSYKNSKFLTYSCFLECHLGVIVIKDYGNSLAYYDSSGKIPLGEYEMGITGPIKSENLKKLINKEKKNFITELSLNNTNLGVNTYRSRRLNAASLNKIPPALDDHAQYLTTFRGVNYEKDEINEDIPIRKYIGINRGRVSQSSSHVPLLEYLNWLDVLNNRFKEDVEISEFFRRYALESEEPRFKDAKNILLDLQDIEDYFFVNDPNAQSKTPLFVDNSCQDVDTGSFSIQANNKRFLIQIDYDSKKKKYILKSNDLDTHYYSEHEDYKSIISFLNKTQSFRIIPRSSGKIYAKYHFFSPKIQYGSQFSREDSIFNQILISDPILKKMSSEKGKMCKAKNKGWDSDSLFDIIDNLGKETTLTEYFGDPDILICDDMDTEIADFILCDTRTNRVVMIHAKGTTKLHPYSASKLQDVCGQASKNLRFLAPGNEELPPNINSWNKMWESSKTTKGKTHRIRKGSGLPLDLWNKIKKIIDNPNSNREIWIFLGRTLSKSDFLKRLYQSRPTPEAIQAAYLLHTILESIGKIGAKFFVFCYP